MGGGGGWRSRPQSESSGRGGGFSLKVWGGGVRSESLSVPRIPPCRRTPMVINLPTPMYNGENVVLGITAYSERTLIELADN